MNAVRDFSIDLWHRRLGHMNKKEIQTLVRKQRLPKVRGNARKSCVDSIYEKQHRIVFQNFSLSRKLNPLEFVHIDICYTKKKSPSGAVYFVTFINDFVR